jgi:carbon-monoxide dehydrogenase medium subunit
MYSAPFEYVRPATLAEAVRLLDERQDEAKLLAGGQSLLPLLKLRLASPALLLDIGRLAELKGIRERDGFIEIGAMVRHSEIESSELLAGLCPLLRETVAVLGDPQVRNRGTLGGSLAHADPAGDLPAAMLALDARFVATSVAGRRTIAAQDFFVDLMTTAVQPNEILTSIEIPELPAHTGSTYRKMRQQASGFAIVGAACVLALDDHRRIQESRVAITGVGPVPYRGRQVEERLRGGVAKTSVFADAASVVAANIEVSSDIHASADYRRELAVIYTRRALERAAARCRNGS